MKCAELNYYEINFKNADINPAVKGERNVVFEGIARMFDEKGFYPNISNISKIIKAGYEISWLNVVRDFGRKGWSNRTILSAMRELDSLISTKESIIDIDLIKSFLSLIITVNVKCYLSFISTATEINLKSF